MAKRNREVTYIPSQAAGERTFVACTRCRCDTFHTVLMGIDEAGSVERHMDDYSWGVHHRIIQCQGCETVSFMRVSDGSSEDPDESEELFPSRTNNWPLLKDYYLLPVSLGGIYIETVAALNNNQPILSGIGIRAIIETISNEQQAAGQNLQLKIDDLVSKGILTKAGADILHKIRTLGNAAAHQVKAHGATELKLAMDVVEHILQAVYILPYHAKQTFK